MDGEFIDVGDKKSVKNRRTKTNFDDKRLTNGLRLALENRDSRYFLWRFLCHTGLYHTSSHLDPHGMAIASGKRDMGLWLIEQLFTADPNSYTILRAEAGETTAKGDIKNATD